MQPMGDAVVAAAYVRWWQPSDERHDEVRSMFGFGSSDECEFESHAGGDHSFLTDMGLLAMRLTTGTLLAGHGAQKLFGVFKGPGLKGTGGWLESLGMKPGHYWAVLAGGAEFFGGLTTALGGQAAPTVVRGGAGSGSGGCRPFRASVSGVASAIASACD